MGAQVMKWKSREVMIGGLPLGGSNPVRIQSMTNTPTRDMAATLAQCKALVRAGCEYIRCTTQGKQELRALKTIREQLEKEALNVPLIADVHFLPSLAEEAASVVHKVRINPGNYGIALSCEVSSGKKLQETREKYFLSLISQCKLHGTALRIGVNHGSLSERIMQLYGDTPEGMAESAMEFLRICEREKFHQLVVSMKASNTRIMVYTTRLLVHKMMAEGMDYPLHLGVTEAGEGEDGRIKSAVGMASLLSEGIGDTIRVSLTEDPVAEIPVAKKILKYSQTGLKFPSGKIPGVDPFSFERRKSLKVLNTGNASPPVIVHSMNGYTSRPKLSDLQVMPDMCFTANPGGNYRDMQGRPMIIPAGSMEESIKSEGKAYIYYTEKQWQRLEKTADLVFLEIGTEESIQLLAQKPGSFTNAILVFRVPGTDAVHTLRRMFSILIRERILFPVILRASYREKDEESLMIRAACELGPLFMDGLPDGSWIDSPLNDGLTALRVSAGILQAARLRMYHTEFISCPSCGRTQFDIQATTRQIREATGHLTGLRIAVMGCIVNGPGEMADADYGYVGAGPGRISLYHRKKLVKKNIKEEDALRELIGLIREKGDWKENI